MHVHVDLAEKLAAADHFDDAAAVHELNAEYHDDPQARAALVALRMEQALQGAGVDAMLSRYRELKSVHAAEAFDPRLLDGLGWRIFRAGQREAGFALFALNYEEHPDSFTATEDLAYGCLEMGQKERAVELAEGWAARHSDHEAGTLTRNEIVRRAKR